MNLMSKFLCILYCENSGIGALMCLKKKKEGSIQKLSSQKAGYVDGYQFFASQFQIYPSLLWLWAYNRHINADA